MEMNTVTVYDIQNKFIAYSAPYPEVIDVMCESGSIFIFTGDRRVSLIYGYCIGIMYAFIHEESPSIVASVCCYLMFCIVWYYSIDQIRYYPELLLKLW